MKLTNFRNTLILVLTLSTSISFSAVFVVDRFEDGRDEFANGVCAATNFVGDRCTLRAAIMESNFSPEADTILIPVGEYVLTRTGEDDNAIFGDLDITGKVTLNNFLDGYVIDGNGTDRIFHILDGGELILNNATLTNGVANTATTFQGGAIKVESSGELTTLGVVFVNNLANRGGALFSDGVTYIIESYFHHNAVTSENTPVHLSSLGHAIFNFRTMYLRRSTVSHNGKLLSNPNNIDLSSGYAIHANPNGNAAPRPRTSIFNSTVADNIGSGIRSDRGLTFIIQSTIANHESQGIRFSRHLDYVGELQLTIRNSLFANNTFQDCNDLWVVPVLETDILGNFNASSDTSCGFTDVNNLENISNPFNGSLSDWGGKTPTLLPWVESPIIDFISFEGTCTSEDQREMLRPLDGDNDGTPFCDVGAVELNRAEDLIISDLIFRNGFEATL